MNKLRKNNIGYINTIRLFICHKNGFKFDVNKYKINNLTRYNIMKIIELIIDEQMELSGIDAISIVENPAIEENFIALNSVQKEYNFAEVSKEKKIIMHKQRLFIVMMRKLSLFRMRMASSTPSIT